MNAGLLRSLVEKHQTTQKPAIGSAYAQTVGVPALFARSCFPVLLSLGDDAGAKSLLLSQPNDVATIAFPGGAIDIDTLDDYQKLSAAGTNEN